MKLLITISYYTPNVSGLTIYARNFAEELAKKGYKVTVLTSRFKSGLKYKEKKNGVKIKRIWTPFLFGRGPIMPTYIFESFFVVSRNDIVNCHLPQFEAILPAIWAKILNKKLVVTYQCDLTIWPGLINKTTVFGAYLSQFFTCILADEIVVLNKDYADNSKFLHIFKDKLNYVYPPIRLARPEYRPFERYKNIKYKIGFVGRLAKEKGLDHLIGSIHYLQKNLGEDFKLFLVGPKKDVVGGSVEKEIAELSKIYKKNLVFLDTLSDEELSGFYKFIDVLVLPSTHKIEAFGMVQIESMLSGCPVVASDIPGVRMPIKLSGMGLVVKPKDSELLANAIVKVIKNKKRYIKNRHEIEKLFDINICINFYEKLFKGIS